MTEKMAKRKRSKRHGAPCRKASRALLIRSQNGQQRINIRGIQDITLWLYTLGTQSVVSRPLWVHSKLATNPLRIIIAIVPSVDKDLLRIYSSGGYKTVEQYMPDLDYFCGEETLKDTTFSVLRAECNHLGTESPKIEKFDPEQCPFVDVNAGRFTQADKFITAFFSYGTSAPSGPAHLKGSLTSDMRLQGFLLTCEEMKRNGYPGFENGLQPKLPPGFISLDDLDSTGVLPPPSPDLLFGIDCEMVETTVGDEVGRVCVIDKEMHIMLDVFVRPGAPVVDYRTAISGLSPDNLESATLCLRDVHVLLKSTLPSGAILVGHSLQFDLKALHLVHLRCIDTSILYPHPIPSLRFSLRRLSQKILLKDLKRSHGTHDPKEDAEAALRLAMEKMRNGPTFGIPLRRTTPFPEVLCGQLNDSSVDNDIYLIDSFSHSKAEMLQGVKIHDTCHDDSDVVNKSIEILRATSEDISTSCDTSTYILNDACGGNGCTPEKKSVGLSATEGFKRKSVVVCVLRSYQRICCAAVTGSPTSNLYAVCEGADAIAGATVTHSEEKLLKSDFTAEGTVDKKRDVNRLKCDSQPRRLAFLEGGTGTHLLHSVPPILSMECLRRIDQNLSRLRDCLSPSDIMIVMSPCGDYYRYFALRAARKRILATKQSSGSQGWPTELEEAFLNAEKAYNSPAKGGWVMSPPSAQ